jgi:hypothetical protein
MTDETKEVAVYNPSSVIELAISKGADLLQLEKVMELQERHEGNEAKKAYVSAMSAFKSDPPNIIRDKHNKQYDSRYSSLENFVNSVIPVLSEHGLSHNWDVTQEENVRVTCTMTHSMGHSESTSMIAPPDDSGKKNPIQQIKSTVTYLKLATFEAITGLASQDGNLDDDGNAAGKQLISEDQENELLKMLHESKLDMDEKFMAQMYEYLKVESLSELPSRDFNKAKMVINQAVKKLGEKK